MERTDVWVTCLVGVSLEVWVFRAELVMETRCPGLGLDVAWGWGRFCGSWTGRVGGGGVCGLGEV